MNCKCKFFRILIPLFISSYSLCLSYPAEKDSLAGILYQRAETWILKGDTASAVEALKSAVRKDRKLASGWHRLAQIYLARGTVKDRLEARWALKEALRLNSKNVDFLHTQVRIYIRSGQLTSAQRTLKKIIQLDPGNIGALCRLGYIHEKDWYHFHDMISPQYNSGGQYMGIFTLAREAEKDYQKSRAYYLKAIELDSCCLQAVYRLVFLCYEKRDYIIMADLVRTALEKAPDNKDLHLFLGLSCYKLKQYANAWKEYDLALSFMKREERMLFESIDLVSTPDEAEQFRLAGSADQEVLEDKFWKIRDPLFLTDVNERKLEHFSRIAYANLCFSRPELGIEGWRSDGGQVIIRYGSPKNSSKTRPDMFCRSYSTWNYPGFNFKFVSYNLKDIFTLANRGYYEKMVQKKPDWYDHIPKGGRLRIDGDVAAFLQNNQENVLEAYHTLIKEEVQPLEEGKEVILKRGLFLVNLAGEEIYRHITSNPILYDFQDAFLIGGHRITSVPETCHVVLEFLDEINGKAGRWAIRWNRRSIDRINLSMSDLVLGWEIGEGGGNWALKRGRVNILPNSYNTYLVSSGIQLYFEIYNLTYTPQGITEYIVELTIEEEQRYEKKGTDYLIYRIFSGKSSSGKVVTEHEYSGDSRKETVYQTMVMENPKPGDYFLTVKVTDLNTGEEAVQIKRFGLRRSGE